MTRMAAGKVARTPHSEKEFPVTVTQGIKWFQVKRAGKWVSVTRVPSKKGERNLTHHFGTVLGRKIGREFRFVYRAK